MTDDRTLERAARSWLEEGPNRAPDRPVEAALARIQTTRQERDLPIPWRFPTMNPIIRIAAAALVAAVALGSVYLVFRPASDVGSPLPTIEGTWETQFTRAEMLAVGIVEGEDNPGNYGHFVLSFRGGRFTNVQLDGPRDVTHGTYVVDGTSIDIQTSLNETFAGVPFTVTETTLTFGQGIPAGVRVKPWIRIGAPNPVASASIVTVDTFREARDAVCVAARPERAAYDARIGTGLYDPETPAEERTASIAAFAEFADWVGRLLDRLEAIPAPAPMAADVSVVSTQARGSLQLIREEIPLLQVGRLADARALDEATGPLSSGIEQFEARYGLEPCP